MRNVLLSSPLFGKQDQAFYRKLRDELRRHNVNLVIPTPYAPAPRSLKHFLTPPASSYGRALRRSKLASLLSKSELEDVVATCELWGKTQRTPSPQQINELALGQEYLLRTLQPSLVIEWNYHNYQNRVLLHLAKKLSIETLCLERTPFPGVLLLDPDGSLCDSELFNNTSTQQIRENVLSSTDTALADYYVDNVLKRGHTWWQQPEAVSPASIREDLEIPKGAKVIVFLGQVDNDTQNFRHNPYFPNNVSAFKGFVESLPTNASFFIIGKQHPKSTVGLVEYRAHIPEGKGVWTDQISIASALEVADLVVAVNSAGAFEAALRGIPTMTLGRSMFSGMQVFFEWSSANDTHTCQRWLNASRDSYRDNTVAGMKILNHFFMRSTYFIEEQTGPLPGVRNLAQDIAHRAKRHKAACRCNQKPISPLQVFLAITFGRSFIAYLGSKLLGGLLTVRNFTRRIN